MVQDGAPKKETKQLRFKQSIWQNPKTIQVTLYSHWVAPLSRDTFYHSGQFESVGKVWPLKWKLRKQNSYLGYYLSWCTRGSDFLILGLWRG